MGRAFFSSIRSAPAIKTEPPPPLNPAYEKWSVTNNFDPDSDEFWDDAQEEQFIEVDQPTEQPSLRELLAEDPESSSSSSEGGDTDRRGSPMAVGSDDPASLVDAYIPGTHIWERIEPEPWNYVSSDWASDERTTVADLREHLSIAEGIRFARTAAAASDTSLPELISSTSPSSSPTMPRYVYPAMSTPSPVMPRIYHWGRRSSAPMIPSSPSRAGNNAGPLTNPTARRSLARIAPVRVRVQGFST